MNSIAAKILLAVFCGILLAILAISLFRMPGDSVQPASASSTASTTAATSSYPSTVVGLNSSTTVAMNTNDFNTAGETYSPSISVSSSSATATIDASPDSSTAVLLAGMKMTFDDEFNSFSRYVDANGNVTCNSGGTGTWQTVYNFCSRTNSANDEAEVYIDPGFLAYLKKESAASSETDTDNPFSIANGVLSIKAAPSSAQVLKAVGSWAQFTSGMITTQFSFSQTYGYFEIRAELPKGAGLWPAFWLLPEDGSWPPEIDALEAFGGTNPSGEGGITQIHYASHAIKSYPSENCGGWYNIGTDITAGFHTYGVDVEPTGVTYFFDGRPYASCPANSATNKPFYMLINLAVGGPGSWPGVPNAATSWPAYLRIDYVRAYQKI